MRKLIAWFAGEGWCPACESELMEDEAGYHPLQEQGVFGGGGLPERWVEVQGRE